MCTNDVVKCVYQHYSADHKKYETLYSQIDSKRETRQLNKIQLETHIFIKLSYDKNSNKNFVKFICIDQDTKQ